jgi:hypothetical protein
VDVLYDGEGKMYLQTGWKKFARNHDVKVDCLFNFFYEHVFEMVVNVHGKRVLSYPLPQLLMQRQ